MNTEKVTPFDIERMLFGDAPPGFLIEVFFRGLALYLFMLLIVRFLGKRMAGELTVTEMVLMVTLGGSVAVAIQVPEGGVLIGFVVLTCAFLFERVFSWLTLQSPRFETISQGCATLLIKDGVLQIANMEDARITKQQIFAALRVEQIHQLGKVERLYLEAGGTFSIYKTSGNSTPGLTVFPEDDADAVKAQVKAEGMKTCSNCGFTAKQEGEGCCSECSETTWADAVL